MHTKSSWWYTYQNLKQIEPIWIPNELVNFDILNFNILNFSFLLYFILLCKYKNDSQQLAFGDKHHLRIESQDLLWE